MNNRTHRNEAEREEEEDAEQFPGKVLKARDRLGENRIGRTVLNVLRQESRGGDYRQERDEKTHRAETDVFQDLEFLLEGHLRHENGAAD